MSGFDAVLISVIPSIGVGLLFWYVMRAVIRADRNERAAIAAQEAALEAERSPGVGAQGDSSDDAGAAAPDVDGADSGNA